MGGLYLVAGFGGGLPACRTSRANWQCQESGATIAAGGAIGSRSRGHVRGVLFTDQCAGVVGDFSFSTGAGSRGDRNPATEQQAL